MKRREQAPALRYEIDFSAKIAEARGRFFCLFLSILKEIGERKEPRVSPLEPTSNAALLMRVVEILFAKPIRARVKQRPSRCASGSLSFLVLLNRFFFLALLSM